MILIVTEKPSVAAEIAAVVGASEKKEGYRIGATHIVTWCFGHLVELAEPSTYCRNWEQWRLDTLPILPEKYQYSVTSKTAKQFATVKRLMHREDVSELIEATDAGREGELIFRLVYHAAGCRKPFRRLWINSLEKSCIQEGLHSAKGSAAYDSLFFAAQCRQQADWLIGINLTRLYSLMHRCKLPCGRVQTPTIALIAQRWDEINSFVPRRYYSIKADLGAFCAYTQTDDQTKAIEILDCCSGAEAVVTKVVTEEKSEKAPGLYDLTTLQREANKLLGYTAQQTLDYAQALYEKKLITYPRTDSRFITGAQEKTVTTLIGCLKKRFDVLVLKHQSENTKQIINDKKVSDHHAILPTVQAADFDITTIPQGEQKLLWMIIVRLLIATYPPMRYKSTVATIDIEGYPFNAKGRDVLESSYSRLEQAMYQLILLEKEGEVDRTTQHLPPMSDGNSYAVMKITMEDKKTKPPQPYTEDTLLKAMERAGATSDDPNERFGGGLGTPATRAGIIENIIKNGYVRRDGKKLLPTQLAYDLLSIVAEKLTSPVLTAEWERSFDAIQRGEETSEHFMHGIYTFLLGFVGDVKLLNSDLCFKEEYQVVGRCPRCGKNVQNHIKGYICESGKDACGFVVWKEMMGKRISEQQIKKLLRIGRTDTIKGFVNKSGKVFDAYLEIDENGNVKFGFPKRR